MLNSRNITRILNCTSVLFLLAGACFPGKGQTSTGEAQPPSSTEATAGDDLKQGVEAYKNAHYDEAIAHFREATSLAPGSLVARRYLATALGQSVIPGLDTQDNLKVAKQAVDTFLEVLDKDPQDVDSMKQIAGIEFSVKDFDEAKEWQKKVLEQDPKDAEAAYMIGQIDWTLAHQNQLEALSSTGILDDGVGNRQAPAEVKETIRAKNAGLVEEALFYLNEAIKSRPDYADAMAYMNLAYRIKAGVDWRNEAAREDDIAAAEQWRTKSMYVRDANEKKSAEANSTKPKPCQPPANP